MDLATRADIDRLLQAFYGRAMVDPLIGYLFTEVAHLDLDHHLPVIGNFWEKVLFQAAVYEGNPMAVHHALHAAATLRPDHFQRWFALWAGCVDDLFEGPVADDAKRRAALIAESMQQHLRIASDPEHFTDAYRQALGMPAAAAAGTAQGFLPVIVLPLLPPSTS